MQRGVLAITKQELSELLNILNIEIFNGTQLYEKFKSASHSNENEIKILLSEDEIERVIDEVGPPIYENTIVNSAIEKINGLMVTLRKNNLPDLDSN